MITRIWTRRDQTRALHMGWGVFQADDGTLQIQRYDASERFPSDTHARYHVKQMADLGYPRHARALKVVAQQSKFYP